MPNSLDGGAVLSTFSMKKAGAILEELQIMASPKWLQLLQRSP
jgi:hypothetical protein